MLVANHLSMLLARRTKPIVAKLQEARDRRASLVSECVASARLLKLRGWIDDAKDQIDDARRVEMRHLVSIRLLDAANVLLGSLSGLAVPASIFSYYTVVDRKILTPAVAFAALAWIQQMRWSVTRRPAVLRRLHAIDARRLQERRSWVVSFSNSRPFGPIGL